MNNRSAQKISFLQFACLIHGLQVGIGQLSLPRELAMKGGSSSWLALFIGYAISVAASLLIIRVMRRRPDGTLIDLLEHYFGKWIGKLGAAVYAVYYCLFAYEIMFSATQIIKSWLIQRTPLYMLIVLLAIPSFIIVSKGMQAMSRYAELVFYMFIPLSAFLLMPLSDSNPLHLLPLFKDGWGPVLHSVRATVLSFAGFEIAFFAYPYLKNKKSAALGVVLGNTFSLIVYLVITLTCFLYFSPDEIIEYNQPALNLLKVIEFRFVERLDIVFLAVYMFMISTSWIPDMFVIAYCGNKLFSRIDPKTYLALLIGSLVATAAILDPSFMLVEKWMKAASSFALFGAFGVPVLLAAYFFVYDRIQGRRSG
ncbi:endospore germination permease [Paenibacillus sp. MBLB4367]|uniref:GerAB/ArcD/ProY family transporter n=1 Tax=Paenibacillus sp. MBLB4367 TaxID=3384767 RepID=UPI003908421A